MKRIVKYEPRLERTGSLLVADKSVNGPNDAVNVLRAFLPGPHVQESFVLLMLSSCNSITGIMEITRGTLNSSLVHPREVFAPALQHRAAAIVVAHNHPSGNPEPSQDDIAVTKQLVDAGRVLGVPIHDHIVFTETGHTSFVERGLIS